MTENMIPQNILEALREFENHRDNVTCLECGYKGMVGIKEDKFNFSLSAAFATVMVALFALLGLYGIILSPTVFGFAIVVALNKTVKTILTCPNCKKDFLG